MKSHKCCKCKRVLPATSFSRSFTQKKGVRSYCKPCFVRRMALRKYKLTESELRSLEQSQSGKCRICNKEKKLQIDHDHNTGKVRGLLCAHCNWALGVYEKHKDNMRHYLKEYG